MTWAWRQSFSWSASCWVTDILSHLPWRAWFKASFPPLYLSLKDHHLLIGHHEVKGMGVAFGGFLCGNTFVSITLVSPPVSIFSSWVQLSNSTSARGRSKELLQLFVSKEACADVGACPEGKSLVWSLCCDIFFFFERVPQRLPSAVSNRGWYGCTLPWVKCNILYKNQTAMFSYCITLCLYSGYTQQ